MRKIFGIIVFGGVLLISACSQKAASPGPEPKQKAAAVSQTSATTASSAGAEPDGEPDFGPATTEKEMYGYQYEVMPYPPPVGPNGEVARFDPDSNTAIGYTGKVVFTSIPKANEPTQWLHLQAENGLAYDLQIVDQGGVDAIGKLDWSKIMVEPIGMKDYLNHKTDDPGTLVFVYKVIHETIPAKSLNGGFCPKTGYIALTAHSQDEHLMVAAFRAGPWPPKDDSAYCGAYSYVRVSP